jgi:hypothetical protein
MWADRILRIGVIVTVVGLGCTLVAIIPLVLPDIDMPSALWFLAMLTGVGLAIVVVGLALQSRARRRSRQGSP